MRFFSTGKHKQPLTNRVKINRSFQRECVPWLGVAARIALQTTNSYSANPCGEVSCANLLLLPHDTVFRVETLQPTARRLKC